MKHISTVYDEKGLTEIIIMTFIRESYRIFKAYNINRLYWNRLIDILVDSISTSIPYIFWDDDGQMYVTHIDTIRIVDNEDCTDFALELDIIDDEDDYLEAEDFCSLFLENFNTLPEDYLNLLKSSDIIYDDFRINMKLNSSLYVLSVALCMVVYLIPNVAHLAFRGTDKDMYDYMRLTLSANTIFNQLLSSLVFKYKGEFGCYMVASKGSIVVHEDRDKTVKSSIINYGVIDDIVIELVDLDLEDCSNLL